MTTGQPRRRHIGAGAIAIAMVLAGLSGLAGTGTVDADSGDGTQDGPECGVLPVDLLVVIDDSRSMAENSWDTLISPTVRDQAIDLISLLEDAGMDLRVSLATFSDYPESYDYPGYTARYGYDVDRPWKLQAPLSGDPGDIQAIKDAIDQITTTKGADEPEAISRVLHEATQQDWRPGANRLVALFTDSHPHDDTFFDDSYGLDPGPDGEARNEDDVDFETVTRAVNDTGVSVLSMHVDSPVYEDEVDHRDRTMRALDHTADETLGEYLDLGDDSVGEAEDRILEIAQRTPDLDAKVPAPGELYVNGTHEGPAPREPAAIVDEIRFQTEVGPDAVEVVFGVEWDLDEPGYEWEDKDPHWEGDTVESKIFPTSQLPKGLYRLDMVVTDDHDRQTCQSVFFEIPPEGRGKVARSQSIDNDDADTSLADTGLAYADTEDSHLGYESSLVTAYDLHSLVDVVGQVGALEVDAQVSIGYLGVVTSVGQLEAYDVRINATAGCGDPTEGESEMHAAQVLLDGEAIVSHEVAPHTADFGTPMGNQIIIHRQDVEPGAAEASMLRVDLGGLLAQGPVDIGSVFADAACGGLDASDYPGNG